MGHGKGVSVAGAELAIRLGSNEGKMRSTLKTKINGLDVEGREESGQL